VSGGQALLSGPPLEVVLPDRHRATPRSRRTAGRDDAARATRWPTLGRRRWGPRTARAGAI